MKIKYQLLGGLLLSALIGANANTNAWADDDHERARELVKRGEIMSLTELLQQVDRVEGGKLRLLEAELENKKDRLVYELEFIDEDGVVRELLFDARTGEALGEEND
ncbi:MAG: PepSY domain-containing protein [Gammaproteobacteria bacterium]|nr:PepSY domain-containing protein [Gammaproteobacteria bacterium]